VDVRLLALVAESGKAAVHEIAARLGMDPREAASRLIALSATGLPLIVGVECDPNGIRAAIANASSWSNYPPRNGPNQGQPNQAGPAQLGPGPAQGVPSDPYSPPPQRQQQQVPQRGYGAAGTPSGSYPQPGSGPCPAPGSSGPYPAPGSGPYPQPVAARQPAQGFAGPASGPIPRPVSAPGGSTWGPPQSSTWARGGQPPRPSGPQHQQPQRQPQPAPQRHSGTVGETLQTEGLDGERIAIDLIEVVDPADFLFTAAGYRLRDGERAVVVHTEMSNLGAVAYQTLPDLYLVLIAADRSTVSKAPVSLSSRPPHRIGVPPGETAGGHTVYVLPEDAKITAVRWSARPDEDRHSLTWTIEN
jgi:hypothetical protein